MKRKTLSLICTVVAAWSVFITGGVRVSAEEKLKVDCKAACLIDYYSGTQVFEKNSSERFPIASMCKIMTLILCFDEIETGNLSLEDDIPVSERAASMGGSQVFLESGNTYKAEELIKSIVVCSANDSCVAMAEHISGSDGIFVDKMNERAKSLGACDTLFANCTGLPKEPQYSTAHDVALMLRELLKNEKYYDFSRIWTEKFVHSDSRFTEMTNTNKLIRTYNGCDGGKTGFTNQAGFCLAATAKRGEMRMISVVIGASDSKSRFDYSKEMLDYAFANYTQKIVVDDAVPLGDKLSVRGGKKNEISVAAQRKGLVFSLKSGGADIDIEFLPDETIAPVNKGDVVGEIIIFKDNVEYDRVKVVALEDDPRAGIADYYKQISEGWKL